MELPKSPTYYLMLESYMKALGKGGLHISTKETATNTSYNKIETAETFKIFQHVVIIDQDLLFSLSSREKDMISLIAKDLKMNNALWYFEINDNTTKRATIKMLKEKDIIKKTEDSHIFVVNPQYIRRGTIPSVLSHTMNVLSTSSRVDRTMIKDLNYKRIEISMYDALEDRG